MAVLEREWKLVLHIPEARQRYIEEASEYRRCIHVDTCTRALAATRASSYLNATRFWLLTVSFILKSRSMPSEGACFRRRIDSMTYLSSMTTTTTTTRQMPCVSALISPPIEPTCFYRRKEDDVYRRATCQSEGRLSSSASYFDYDIVTVKVRKT